MALKCILKVLLKYCADGKPSVSAIYAMLIVSSSRSRFASSILTPRLKDWNEDLVQSLEETEEAGMQQTM